MMVPALPSTPTTVNYTATQILGGFTGPIDTIQNAARVYCRTEITLWSGWIYGTEAKLTMTSDYGDYDGAVQVAVDGGAFGSAARTGQVHTLFTGLPQAGHFVEFRVAPGLGDAAYIPATGNILSVTGIPPSLLLLTNKIQVGGDSATGLYSGSMVANTANFTPLLQAPSGQTYGSNIGSVKIKGAFTKLVVTLNGARKIGVCQNGGPPTFYSIAEESNNPSRAIVIPCDGSTSTYNIWDSGNSVNSGGVFAVAGDSTFLDIGTRRRIEQYGDSVTYGSGPGATPVDSELMSVAAKLGFVGSTNGISGQTVGGGKAMIDSCLAGRVVGPNDVAILSLGGNSAESGIDSTEQADYGACIDKLLAKGYGKVLCRGIFPIADTNTNNIAIAANATLKSVMDAKANPKLIWIDTSTWTGYETIDGVHPTAAGYVTLAGYAYAKYASLGL
jgi:lysophospholipase L1-like esterase